MVGRGHSSHVKVRSGGQSIAVLVVVLPAAEPRLVLKDCRRDAMSVCVRMWVAELSALARAHSLTYIHTCKHTYIHTFIHTCKHKHKHCHAHYLASRNSSRLPGTFRTTHHHSTSHPLRRLRLRGSDLPPLPLAHAMIAPPYPPQLHPS